MNKLKNIAIVLGPRILGALFGGIATWVGVKTSGAVTIDPEAAAATVTAILVSYSAAHKGASSQVNPGDAAKGRVADGIKAAADDPNVDTVVRIPEN